MRAYRRIWLISACAYISTARKVGLIIQGALNKQVQLSGCGLICYCLAPGAWNGVPIRECNSRTSRQQAVLDAYHWRGADGDRRRWQSPCTIPIDGEVLRSSRVMSSPELDRGEFILPWVALSPLWRVQPCLGALTKSSLLVTRCRHDLTLLFYTCA